MMWVGEACPVSAETSLSDTSPQGLSSVDSYDTLPKKTSELHHVERIIYILCVEKIIQRVISPKHHLLVKVYCRNLANE